MKLVRGGSTLKMTPAQLQRKVEVAQKARDGVEASGEALKVHWTAVLESGSPVGLISGDLAGSIRVTKRHAIDPRVSVGTPVFYGRILHFGVPGRIEPKPHGEVALNRATEDMNNAFRQATK